MRLKTYTAPTIAQAMDMIRRDLGDSAIIIQTQGERGRQGARVTAAVEERPSTSGQNTSGPKARNADAPGGSLPEATAIEAALVRHGMPQPLVQVLTVEAAAYDAEDPVLALSAALDTVVSFQPICDGTQQRPILLFGAPGCGKTLTAAKLIVRARRAQRSVTAVSTDLARAGGVEQLEALMRVAQVPLTAAEGAAALTAAVAEAGEHLVVIDTAGCNLFDDADLMDVQELAQAVDAEPVFVLAAGSDRAESIEMAERAAFIGCRRMIVSRIDIVRRLGSVIAAAEATGLCLADVGIGPQVADSLVPINPVSLARLLLPIDEPDGSPSLLKEAPR
jgi:flagellar biosynthesis protein FlhF